ncbi:amidase [Acidicapsa dinghuensis]|uniref:Amidase n=1 Tax=Acidicapsa dinghuensis TaxID=2218256 RepID=A0ABW1EL42_9BACT|nr:amidase family protein [Acidicapsa dinghuensis]
MAHDKKAAIEDLVNTAFSLSNGGANRNTYLWQEQSWTFSEVRRIASMPADTSTIFADGHEPLWGIPVSVKDCFDLAGAPTTCGTRFYEALHGSAAADSWLVEKLRAAGAVIIGKTHLHPLAYGITGENAEFGDCVQPGDPDNLTGGSSSGAAASVLEGSAMAAIGTDTGGSVRVPAALCGLAGYRASLGRGDWRGGAHLAQSFDTMGWLFADLEDAPLLGSFFAPQSETTTAEQDSLPKRFAIVHDEFFSDCDPEVLEGLRLCRAELEFLGLRAETVNVPWWNDSCEIYSTIQAWEAARIHAGYYAEFGPAIQQRLEWGASISDDEITRLRKRHTEFRERMDMLLADHELLLMPAAPVAKLTVGADHSQTRARLLRYTTPVSLAGMPAITIPFSKEHCKTGGMQLAAAREDDSRLLQLAARMGSARKAQ